MKTWKSCIYIVTRLVAGGFYFEEEANKIINDTKVGKNNRINPKGIVT